MNWILNHGMDDFCEDSKEGKRTYTSESEGPTLLEEIISPPLAKDAS